MFVRQCFKTKARHRFFIRPAHVQAFLTTYPVLPFTPGLALGQQFLGWSGDVNGQDNPLTLLLHSNKRITANFTRLSRLDIHRFEGGMQLFLSAIPRLVYQIDASNNLQNWETVLTGTNFFEGVDYLDRLAVNSQYRFFGTKSLIKLSVLSRVAEPKAVV
jgi:hypothetical protein